MSLDNLKYFHDVPFKGAWHVLDQNGRVGYTAGLYGRERNLTVAEYKLANPGNYSEIMDWKQADIVTEKYETEKYLNQPVTIITETDYWNALECLPPMNWCKVDGIESFMMSEMMTSDITSCYATDGTVYKEFYVRTSWTAKQIADKFSQGAGQ